jgi:hypothetical protein
MLYPLENSRKDTSLPDEPLLEMYEAGANLKKLQLAANLTLLTVWLVPPLCFIIAYLHQLESASYELIIISLFILVLSLATRSFGILVRKKVFYYQLEKAKTRYNIAAIRLKLYENQITWD